MVLEDRESDEIHASLIQASLISQAIDLFASGLDRSLSDGTRTAAIRACESLIKDPNAYEAVRRAALSVPQTNDAWDREGALRLAGQSVAERIENIYSEAKDRHDEIIALYAALDHALLHGHAPIFREVVLKGIRQSRLVADLLSGRHDVATSDDLKKRIADALQSVEIPVEEIPKISTEIFPALMSFASAPEASTQAVSIAATYLREAAQVDQFAKSWAELATRSVGKSRASEHEVPTALICDNSLLHGGLRHVLAETPYKIVYDAVEVDSSLDRAVAQEPALFILAAFNPFSRMLDMATHLQERSVAARIVLLVDHLEPVHVMLGRAAGIDGFCSIRSSNEVLLTSLELVMLGESVLPKGILDTILSGRTMDLGAEYATAVSNSLKASDLGARQLSLREREILQALTTGEPNKVIAQRLKMTEATVKVQVKAILRKLGAANRTQAAIWAAKHFTREEDLFHVENPTHLSSWLLGVRQSG
jgi:two-component system nitrate/nitrite response regulator NarL